MPRSAATGVYTRVSNSFSQPVFGTLIDPTDADAYFDDLDVGLNPANFAGPTNIIGALTLGKAGTTVGTLGFFNATSGSITLSPPTGALGSQVLTLPDATDTLVGKATTDILLNKTYDTAGTGNSFSINGVAVTANTGTGSVVRSISPSITGSFTVTSSSANALTVGLIGSTNSAFQVDASVALQVAGIKVVGAVTGGTVQLSTIDSGAAANLQIDSKGGGQLTFNATATGPIVLTRATTISAALTYGAVTLANSVTGTGSMVLSSSPTLVTPALGTPSSGVGTNLTALNASNLGSGNVPTARVAIVSAFNVNKNSVDQTGVVSATFTAITWPNELYDINNHFASNGWTPDAGKVTMSAAFFATGTITAGAQCAIALFKNGSNFKQTSWSSLTGAATAAVTVDDIANGSDVYTVQAFITTSAGTATITGNPQNTFFAGHWFSP